MNRPVAIVTGAASGIGAAIARHLADSNWCVTINYRSNRSDAERVAAEREAKGANVLVAKGSVDKDADCRRLASATIGKWGRIDALVNNAGVTRFCKAEDLEGLSGEDFEAIFAVNVIGVFQMVRACAPALKKSSRGSIVNISSHGAFSGLGSSMAYAASKAALNNLTLALARALAPNIRVNAICPGFVDTRWTRGSMDESTYQRFKSYIENMTPLEHMTTADEVAECAMHLITGSSSITGQLLVVDGGNHLTVNAPDFQM